MEFDSPAFVFSIIGMALLAGPVIYFLVHTTEESGKNRVRQIYADLVKEKLDVIKTAIAMGRSQDEIRELDERLEKLIGTEKMLKTLKKGKPDPGQEAALRDMDLVGEVDRQGGSKTGEVQ